MKWEISNSALTRSGGALQRNDLVDRVVELAFRNKQIMSGLKIDPEPGRRTEITRKPQGRVCGNIAALTNNLLHAITRNEQRLGKSTRRQAVFGQKVLPKNFAGVNRPRPVINGSIFVRLCHGATLFREASNLNDLHAQRIRSPAGEAP